MAIMRVRVSTLAVFTVIVASCSNCITAFVSSGLIPAAGGTFMDTRTTRTTVRISSSSSRLSYANATSHRNDDNGTQRQQQQVPEKALSGLVGDMLSNMREQDRAQEELDQLQQELKAESSSSSCNKDMPPVDQYGLYRVVNEAQLQNLQEAFPDKLMVLKFSAPWCQACRALANRFKPFLQEHRRQNTTPHVIFADISCGNRGQQSSSSCSSSGGASCDTLGIWQLPSMQFYAPGGELLDSFACGPTRLTWTDLQRKMFQFIDTTDPKRAHGGGVKKGLLRRIWRGIVTTVKP